MAELVVTIDTVGERAIIAKFSSWSRRAADITPAYTAIAEMMLAYERELFASEGAISGHPWEPLSEATIETKTREGLPLSIGVASGETEDSLTQESHERHIQEITPEYLRFGSMSDAAGFQQKGTTKHDMPARKVLDFNEERIAAFSRAIFLYVTKGLLGAEAVAL